MTNLNLGIKSSKKQSIAQGLSKLLAETYTLYLKTHKYHWNVEGPHFHALHTMFENQYTELALAVDIIAERIRVMDVKAPGSYKEFSALSEVVDDPNLNALPMAMLDVLLKDHEQIISTAKNLLPLLEGANDEGTNSLLGARIEVHEKTAWMLKSTMR